ncbi:hypothetical protein CMQ_2229 [Grosmannia clavigera kw1407]|uniref:NADAR domain-containing protein n=1 Tax=Grosmannia clavigera (strain kw1407 / UAMH 11150) TaxID=655863 RepID=F0XJ74_GROCL|nr:uncharacterized protein CMQ_2229 [Grosmannia clavigera kw1407]EFX02180.1 hypothetical protein CMQ_2229 [Grosmannia clavigera kw1407]
MAEQLVAEDDEEYPVFFYGGKEGEYAEFSQFARATFTVPHARIAAVLGRPVAKVAAIAGPDAATEITFSAAEQFMMYCKAVCFGDAAVAWQILAAATPREQKKLGRQVHGFTDEAWDEVKLAVVAAGNAAKFGQSPKRRRLLLGTGTRLLAEAAPRDRIWGIGFGATNAMLNRDLWGQNLLGKALMMARDELRQEEAVEG